MHSRSREFGYGGTSSSDGQFFKAGGHGEARADYNAKYGSEPGVKVYTHVSDRYAPFHTKVIAANASEAAHILDGLLYHECSLDIREHLPTRRAPSITCSVSVISRDLHSRRALAILLIAGFMSLTLVHRIDHSIR
jgi:TnpA family transposase